MFNNVKQIYYLDKSMTETTKISIKYVELTITETPTFKNVEF